MKIGRNDPCFCGSGKKYKKCCINKEHDSRPSYAAQKVEELATELFSHLEEDDHWWDSELVAYSKEERLKLFTAMLVHPANQHAYDFLSEMTIETLGDPPGEERPLDLAALQPIVLEAFEQYQEEQWKEEEAFAHTIAYQNTHYPILYSFHDYNRYILPLMLETLAQSPLLADVDAQCHRGVLLLLQLSARVFDRRQQVEAVETEGSNQLLHHPTPTQYAQWCAPVVLPLETWEAMRAEVGMSEDEAAALMYPADEIAQMQAPELYVPTSHALYPIEDGAALLILPTLIHTAISAHLSGCLEAPEQRATYQNTYARVLFEEMRRHAELVGWQPLQNGRIKPSARYDVLQEEFYETPEGYLVYLVLQHTFVDEASEQTYRSVRPARRIDRVVDKLLQYHQKQVLPIYTAINPEREYQLHQEYDIIEYGIAGVRFLDQCQRYLSEPFDWWEGGP